MKTRRPLTTAFKTKVVLEALKEREPITALAQKYQVHANQITTWKRQFLENAEKALETGTRPSKDEQQQIEQLFEQIGRLQVENAFLKKVM